MPINLVSEEDLRDALRPHRVDANGFAAAVRERIKITEERREREPAPTFSPWQRKVAAFLPLEVIAGSKIAAAPSAAAPAAGYKLLSYLVFPAVCLFVLLGATVFSWGKIRSIQKTNQPETEDEQSLQRRITEWWRQNRWSAMLVFAVTIVLSFVGATWLLFTLYIASLGLLICVLTSLAKLGIGNRQVIAQTCLMGLMFLAQTSMFVGVGDNDIHFVDQMLVGAVLWIGVLVLMPFGASNFQATAPPSEKIPLWQFGLLFFQIPFLLILWWIFPFLNILLWVAAAFGVLIALLAWGDYRQRKQAPPIAWLRKRVFARIFVAVAIPLTAWWVYSILTPVSPAQIKHYVEGFDYAPFTSATWSEWEIPARWAIDSNLEPDLAKPRQLLDQEIAGEQNPFILGVAFRVGLIATDRIDQLRDYELRRRSLLDDPNHFSEKLPILSLEQVDWVIRAAALRNELSPEQRDYLQKRLLITMDKLTSNLYVVLRTALRVTELLDVIERPIDRDRYRSQVHDWLLSAHATTGGGFQLAGGFKGYAASPVASMDATSDAIQLMAIYGIPDGLNVDWVRSYLRTRFFRSGNEKWMAPAMLNRLNDLPGVAHPTWFRVLYYERSLVAALILTVLCIYATLISPKHETIGCGESVVGN